jgi:tRNA pseudouridine38-40 synthase
MVRAVVGTLIDVGRGRLTLEEFRRVVEGKKRTEAGESMPAHALFLEDITY